ncbi:type I-U CRISPR-associated protein Csb2 [Streptomyces sp. NPDC087532]|uniref:type I-G CRISPR-associated protein Csb2 n=1 Tax=unclassified Streptomyces TaxID=2593676 RepID=UPI003329756B
MPFRTTVHLLDSSYQASTLDRSRAEWPPHPYRVFCALVSVADPQDPLQDAALQWLERQPAPVVRVPEQSAEAHTPRSAWVPTNAVASKPSHGSLPGRTAGGQTRVWRQRVLAEPVIVFEWPTTPPAGVAAVLESLARSVPYLGRVTGQSLLHTTTAPAEEDGSQGGPWQVWEPAGDDTAAGVHSLRAPYPGMLERLRWAHAEGQNAFQQARPHPYVLREAQPAEEPALVKGPYADLVSFAFGPGCSLDTQLTLKVTGALRGRVCDLLEEAGHDLDAMVAVHGHKERGDDRGVCAFVGLPFVGHRHADGRLRGVGVALPRDLDPEHRQAVLAVLLRTDGGLRTLQVPALGWPLELSYVGEGATRTDAVATVRPQRWMRPSRQWSTALPMVLDYFPRRNGREIEESVAASCRLAGLPEPQGIEVLRTGAYVPGAPTLSQGAARRKSTERPLPVRHVRLRFAEPVAGPVLLGSKRNYGLGLCLPLDTDDGLCA